MQSVGVHPPAQCGRKEGLEGQTQSILCTCLRQSAGCGAQGVTLGRTWPALFPPVKFPPISLSCYFQACVAEASSRHKVLLLKHPRESPRPYCNSLPLSNSPGSTAGLLHLIFICLQKIKPSPGKGHCFPKEESPFTLVPARN